MEMNSNVTTNELAVKMKVDHSAILQHFSTIRKIKKVDILVLHELTKRHKLNRLYVYSSLLTRPIREPFFDRIVISNEK